MVKDKMWDTTDQPALDFAYYKRVEYPVDHSAPRWTEFKISDLLRHLDYLIGYVTELGTTNTSIWTAVKDINSYAEDTGNQWGYATKGYLKLLKNSRVNTGTLEVEDLYNTSELVNNQQVRFYPKGYFYDLWEDELLVEHDVAVLTNKAVYYRWDNVNNRYQQINYGDLVAGEYLASDYSLLSKYAIPDKKAWLNKLMRFPAFSWREYLKGLRKVHHKGISELRKASYDPSEYATTWNGDWDYLYPGAFEDEASPVYLVDDSNPWIGLDHLIYGFRDEYSSDTFDSLRNFGPAYGGDVAPTPQGFTVADTARVVLSNINSRGDQLNFLERISGTLEDELGVADESVEDGSKVSHALDGVTFVPDTSMTPEEEFDWRDAMASLETEMYHDYWNDSYAYMNQITPDKVYRINKVYRRVKNRLVNELDNCWDMHLTSVYNTKSWKHTTKGRHQWGGSRNTIREPEPLLVTPTTQVTSLAGTVYDLDEEDMERYGNFETLSKLN